MTDGEAFSLSLRCDFSFVSTRGKNVFTVQTFIVPNFPKNIGSSSSKEAMAQFYIGEMLNYHPSVFQNVRFLADPIHAGFPSPATIGRSKDWM